MEKRSVISGNSLLPISLVILIIGGVSWLTTIYERSNDAYAAVRVLSNKQATFQDKIADALLELSQRLARIEQDITYLKEQSKKEHRK